MPSSPSPTGRKGNRFYWRLCSAGAVLCSVLTFTPLVIPAGRYEPMLGGVPLTLWAGIGVAVALVLLTLAGARTHPRIDPPQPERR